MKRLEIKEFTISMAPEFSRISKDKDNRAFLPDEVFETAEEAAEIIRLFNKRYRDGGSPQVYALVEKQSGALVGHVEAARMKDGRWEVGYHIGEEFKGRGYASEGLRLFVPFVMNRLGIKEVLGVCVEENVPSARVLEKCGFSLEYKGIGPYQGRQRPIRRYVYRKEEV